MCDQVFFGSDTLVSELLRQCHNFRYPLIFVLKKLSVSSVLLIGLYLLHRFFWPF